jgi:surface antigen
MTGRMIALVAGAVAAGFATGWASPAEARAPLSMEEVNGDAAAFGEASAHAEAAPSAFAPAGEEAFVANATLDRTAPPQQCVPFARRLSGVEIYGNANTWWRQAASSAYDRIERPEIGAVMAMLGYRTSARGHVAVVVEVVSERMVLVDHANWLNSGEVTRGVPVRDVSAAGDWSAVQVWHVPGGHWGGRIYGVQGFILPQSEPEKPFGAVGWRQATLPAVDAAAQG